MSIVVSTLASKCAKQRCAKKIGVEGWERKKFNVALVGLHKGVTLVCILGAFGALNWSETWSTFL